MKAICKLAPMGENGLEGYMLNHSYEVTQQPNRYTVCINANAVEADIISPVIFHKYFAILHAKPNETIHYEEITVVHLEDGHQCGECCYLNNGHVRSNYPDDPCTFCKLHDKKVWKSRIILKPYKGINHG